MPAASLLPIARRRRARRSGPRRPSGLSISSRMRRPMYGNWIASRARSSAGSLKTIAANFRRSISPAAVEDVGAPACDNLGLDVRLAQAFVPEGVTGNEQAAVACELGGDEAFAAANTADDTDDGFVVHGVPV